MILPRSQGSTKSRLQIEDDSWILKALTPIWTGGAERRGDCLIPTGLLGSIRWWFEVVVRGLGASACDPTLDKNRCPAPKLKEATDAGHHCIACELFGCTGWSRKFRLQVLNGNGDVIANTIAKNTKFRLCFIPFRIITKEEWSLLHRTLSLIANYGAIGGRTVFKPSDESSRSNAWQHSDYGLVELVERPPTVAQINRKTLEDYVRSRRWRTVHDDDFAWASLQNFWCVKGRYLGRQNLRKSAFNRVVGRKEPKVQAQQLLNSDAVAKWLAGKQQESKKVFSFKEPKGARRTFGFVKPGMVDFDQMKQRLKDAWPDLRHDDFKTAKLIIEALFEGGTGDGR